MSGIGPYGVFGSHLQTLPAAEVRRWSAAVEDSGYSALWFGESSSREAFTHAGLLLSTTARIVVATGVANIWARDPAATANATRTLSEAWPGRFILGLGVSHAPMVRRRGHEYRRPVAAMASYLADLDATPYSGPPPSIRSPRVLAALGPRMLDLASRVTDGAFTFFSPVAHTHTARQRLGPDRTLVVQQGFVTCRSRHEAREVAGSFVSHCLTLTNYRSNLLRLGWSEAQLAEGGTDELFDAVVAWGSPEVIAERVRHHRAAGADQVAISPYRAEPGVALDELRKVAEALRLI